MPTYDYACTECSHRFEHFQSITSDPLCECPECQGKLRRLIGAGGALIFKGSGFYETDYKRNGTRQGGSNGKSASDSKPSADTSSSSSKKEETGSSSKEKTSSSTSAA